MRTNALWIDQIKDRDGTSICIYDLAFSPDGALLMVAADNKIYVYDITDGSLIQTLKGHKETVLCLAYAHDGKRFASGSADKQVIIWTNKMEGILKFSHNESVRSLQYNPKSHQLLSCTSSDFGLWSPEQKTVVKNKSPNQINCCAWNEDGTLFALGLNSGIVSIRHKTGDEKLKIDRNGAIWGCFFFKGKDNTDMLALADWSKTLSFFDANGAQSQADRSLTFDPLFMTPFSNNELILLGGSNKKVQLYTLEGSLLETISTQSSWIWTCRALQNKLAIGGQDGSLSVFELTLMTVHSLYKDRYACRVSMTDVVLENLLSTEKVRIKCRQLIKKLAVYESTIAIQLPERIIIYELSDDSDPTDMNYKVKEKINIKIECSLLVLCSSNLILCQEKRLQSLSFSGQLEKEWFFESPIRYIKTIGGVPRHEGLLVGLKSGQIQNIFLHSMFQIDIIKLTHSIRCIDLSAKHQKIAIIDEKNKCFIYDLATKKLLFEESNITSIAWNANYEDLLCLAGPGFIGVKTEQLPIQIVNNQFSSKTFVIGYSGCKIFTLQHNTVITQKISYSKLLFQYLEKNMIDAAYSVACLNVTHEDWQALSNSAMSKSNLEIARKCLIRLSDWPYLDLIDTHSQTIGSAFSPEQYEQIFLAKFYSYRGLFSEAAKLYKKIKAEHLAVEMFNDLQMFDQANDYRVTSSQATLESKALAPPENAKKTSQSGNLGDIQTMSQLYISNGEYNKASQLIAASSVENIMNMVGQLNKGESKLLSLIADYFISKDDFYHAIEVYQKMGDSKNLAQAYIKANQWDDAFKIARDFPQLKADVYLPYALWLAESERFIEAQQAFLEAGQRHESFNVLNQLLLNSVNENRFNDAAYYSWLLANYFSQLNGAPGEKSALINDDTEGWSTKADRLYRQADIYYAYHPIYKYIEEPFTSVFVDILFNSALFLFHFLDDRFPLGVSKVNILFALTKLGKSLGHYKLVRIAYKSLQALRLPAQLDELVEIGSIEIRTKPFVDAEDLASFCYRCSATNSLFASKLNKCINCQQPFNQSFYSFDILPLVEFEVDNQLTHEQIQLILSKNEIKDKEKADRRGSQSSRKEKIDLNSQTLEVYSHDSLVTEYDKEGFNIFTASENVNEATNLIILGEAELAKLDPAHLVTFPKRTQGDPSKRQYQYFLNMMPEISIIACSHCNKFFYSDEFEFQILKNGKCPFCRN